MLKKMSLQNICINTIINNIIDYKELPAHLVDNIYFEIHKRAFNNTLLVLDIIYEEMVYIDNISITKIKPCKRKDVDWSDLDYIFIKYKINTSTYNKYIQKIEFYIDEL